MLGELHRVPRWERPFWVFEQLEVALNEGIWERVLWAATGRVIWRWRLNSGVRLNRQHPDTFEIPDEEERRAAAPGVVVKLMFTINDVWADTSGANVCGSRSSLSRGATSSASSSTSRLASRVSTTA